MAEKHKCAATVWGDYNPYPCSRSWSLEHEGKWWCKKHHPPTVKKFNDDRNARWQAKLDSEALSAKKKETERKLGELALEYMRQEYPAFVAEWEKSINAE